MEQFQYLIINQAKWAQLYAEQEKVKRSERLKTNKEKNWYGNSNEYRNEWVRQNKRKVREPKGHRFADPKTPPKQFASTF